MKKLICIALCLLLLLSFAACSAEQAESSAIDSIKSTDALPEKAQTLALKHEETETPALSAEAEGSKNTNHPLPEAANSGDCAADQLAEEDVSEG